MKLPNVRMYWSTGTRIPGIADVMSVNRFEKIRQYFHCNGNAKKLEKSDLNYDKLYKVRPVLESVLEKCKQVPTEEFQSIDEQIIPTKQYLPKKPNKWGIKVWARCGDSGIVYEFEVYTGKGSSKNDEIPLILLAVNVVFRLTRMLPKHKRFEVFFDNFFSSVNLLRLLTDDGLLAVATLRKDRMKGAEQSLTSVKELKRKGRGAYDYAVEANSGVTIVRWFDNSDVQLISNFIGNGLGTLARRWSKAQAEYIDLDRPEIVEVYNAHMGGVDLCDMLLSCYRIRRRTNKYYIHIVYYLIGISVTNSWLLYRRHQQQKNVPAKNIMRLLDFQMEIANDLRHANKPVPTTSRPKGRPSLASLYSQPEPSGKVRKSPTMPNPTKGVQTDKIDHFP